MTVMTEDSHVSRALGFLLQPGIYFGLGGQSPWPDDDAPPEPNPLSKIDDVFSYRSAESKTLVVPDENGTLIYKGKTWAFVEQSQAYARGAKWAYLDARFKWDEHPLSTFRRVGLYSNLIKNPEIPNNKMNILPSEVLSQGVLECVEFVKPSSRNRDKIETMFLIIEF